MTRPDGGSHTSPAQRYLPPEERAREDSGLILRTEVSVLPNPTSDLTEMVAVAWVCLLVVPVIDVGNI